ncbi:MAG: hypothetical protein CMJ78_20715 [Planctomycetaceae bacterium]|nr:hypothetical protein [Planctomycetaceae bacterium]
MAEGNSVRDRIIQLAREIEEFSKTNMPPEAFFDEFLKRVIGAIGAKAGAVWMLNQGNQLQMFREIGVQDSGFFQQPDAAAKNQKLLVDVLSNGQACTHSKGEGKDLPSDELLILAGLQRNKELIGVVEIFQRADTPVQARPGFLQFVEQMCGYACRYLDRMGRGGSAMTAELADKFENMVLQVHRSMDVTEVAATASNDARLLLDADRCSVAVRYGKKTRIEAISGQDSVNHRANLVRTMASLTKFVIKMRETILYSGKLGNLPKDIEEPLADYIQESGSRMVMIVPLFDREVVDPDSEPQFFESEEKDSGNSKPKDKPIGALIVEQVAESTPKHGLVERTELVAPHVGFAMANARRHQKLFLMPVWKRVGRFASWFRGKNLAKSIAVLMLLIAFAVCMIFIDYDYRVEGEGRLMPIVSQDVFTPWDGKVIEIYVDTKQKVKKGTPLLRVYNEDLNSQLVAAQSELSEKQQYREALYAEYNKAFETGDRQETVRLEGEIVDVEVEIRGAMAQEVLLRRRIDDLIVKAPIDGTVATFQLEQLLLNRPVRRGEVMMEIKNEAGPWRLELEVEEARMGHIIRAQELEARTDLEVEFVSATAAERKYQGELANIAPRSLKSEEGLTVYEVIADTDAKQIENLRIGAEVRAKINCGKQKLGYVLFGDVIEFAQTHLWFGDRKAEKNQLTQTSLPRGSTKVE